MEYRNSSASQHLRNGAIFSKDSSHGVEISGGSTGGRIDAVGDDANITLTLAGKGTGETRIGNSSSPSVFAGAASFGSISSVGSITQTTGSILMTGSTAPFAGFIRFTDTAVSTPDFNTTNAMVKETTHVITGVNSSHFVIANPVNLSTDIIITSVFAGSTAGDVHCYLAKLSTLTVAATTGTIRFLITRF